MNNVDSKYSNDPKMMALVHDAAVFLKLLNLDVIPKYLHNDINNLRNRFLDALPEDNPNHVSLNDDDDEVRKPLYKVGDCVYAYFSSYWVDRVVVKMFFDDNKDMYVYYTKPTKASISLSLNTFAEVEIDFVANRMPSN